MSYQNQKPRRTAQAPVLPPASPLTPAQRERAARMRDQWRQHFGDDDFIRQMVDAGLIHGWRDVIAVTPIEDPTYGRD